jgi:solute carrier family 10 (sodium/bile acid cotransporter), member 7
LTTAPKGSFLARHWFLMALATVLPTGVLASDSLAAWNAYTWPRTVLVCVVMGLMALPIPLELIRRSLARPWPAILASLVNMGLVPVLSWLAAWMLSPYLGGGLIVAAAIPCTLASAAVWTRRAGGDDTVAILVTLITNSLCVLITPLWLVLLLGRTIRLDVWPLVWELFLVVLLPILVAQAARRQRRVAQWAERYKLGLAVVCQLGILIMVFSGAIQMGQHMNAAGAVQQGETVSSLEILWTVCLAAVIHLVAMAAGWYLAAISGLARPQKIGVAISGSQKTLMIGLKMALDCGVSIVPMVAFHVGQLLLDTLIADRWRNASGGAEIASAAPPAKV